MGGVVIPPVRYPAPVRLVLDTSVLVAAFRSHTGASRRLLTLLSQQRFELVFLRRFILSTRRFLLVLNKSQSTGFRY